MYLENVPADTIADVCAGLVRNGVCFRARPNADGTYTVEFTGGY